MHVMELPVVKDLINLSYDFGTDASKRSWQIVVDLVSPMKQPSWWIHHLSYYIGLGVRIFVWVFRKVQQKFNSIVETRILPAIGL